MLYRAKELLKRTWFDQICRDVLSTVPIHTKKSDLVIVTMVSHRDLLMYLIAIKSIYNYINNGEIVILNDGTLTEQDIALLKQHISFLAIYNVDDIKTGKCPKCGTWERFFLISEYIKDYYVIQIDSDTVTIGEIPEITKCLKDNNSFILGTEVSQNFQPIRDTSKRMKLEDSPHVQVIAEKNLDKLEHSDRLMYARGCSGFAGFAKGSFSWSNVENFSQRMSAIVGEKWIEWGSEQVATNFIIANSPYARVLPYPKYASYYPHLEVNYSNSSFLHFIGKNRFENNFYIEKARDAIKAYDNDHMLNAVS
jgi:hypothetical protein